MWFERASKCRLFRRFDRLCRAESLHKSLHNPDSPAGAIEGEIAYISLYFVIFPCRSHDHARNRSSSEGGLPERVCSRVAIWKALIQSEPNAYSELLTPPLIVQSFASLIPQVIGWELAGVSLRIDGDLGVVIDAGELDVANLVAIMSERQFTVLSFLKA